MSLHRLHLLGRVPKIKNVPIYKKASRLRQQKEREILKALWVSDNVPVRWNDGPSPVDMFQFRQHMKSQRWQQGNVRRILRSGVLFLLGLGVCAACLIYKTIVGLDYSYRFFPDVARLERAEIYFPAIMTGDDPENRRKKSKHKFMLLPWLQSHSNDLWTLLGLCRSEDRNTRHLGVQAIGQQHNWSDAEFRMVAQAMDTRTMIGLARSVGVDSRLFLPPPRLPPGTIDIESQLRHLLSELPKNDLDKCTKYFMSNALLDSSQPSKDERGGLWCFGGNGLAFAESLSPVPPVVVELFCLQALVKHSRLASHCPLIVEAGGLQIMRRIHDTRQNSLKIIRQIARILANLSLYQNLHDDIIKAGWVTILSRWLQSDDFALKLHAAKALANLDRDFGVTRLYPDSVYLYYPQFRYREPVYADVVFIPGLLGGPFRTWRQHDCMKPKKISNKDKKSSISSDESAIELKNADKEDMTDSESSNQTLKEGVLKVVTSAIGSEVAPSEAESLPYTICWPQDWLAKDCPHIRILTVEYETHLSEWAPRCPYESEKRTIESRGKELLEKLQIAGLGERPIIWVGHSMGGLLIKQMLNLANQMPSMQHIVKQSKGIIFYSVPHKGSQLAAYSNHTKFLLYPSVEVKELDQGSESLRKLHEDFTNLMFETGIPLLSFAEGLKTELPLNLKVMIVPSASSDPGFGEFHIMKHLNHLAICKPINKDSKLYQLTLEFIRDCIPQHRVDHILKANMREDYIFPVNLGEKKL